MLIGPHLATRAGRLAAVLAAALVLVTTPFLRPGMPILVAALAILVGLVVPVPASTSTTTTGLGRGTVDGPVDGPVAES